MDRLIFYTTLGCHLCEEAWTLIDPLARRWQLEVEQVDIADDDALLAAYGERIPVLRSEPDGRELAWPFDTGALIGFLGL